MSEIKKEKKQNKSGLSIGVITLIIILLGFIIYFAVDMIKMKSNTKSKSEAEVEALNLQTPVKGQTKRGDGPYVADEEYTAKSGLKVSLVSFEKGITNDKIDSNSEQLVRIEFERKNPTQEMIEVATPTLTADGVDYSNAKYLDMKDFDYKTIIESSTISEGVIYFKIPKDVKDITLSILFDKDTNERTYFSTEEVNTDEANSNTTATTYSMVSNTINN